MAKSWLSILGLYNYDNTVLDNLQLPEAVDRATLVNNLLVDAAELELLYHDPVMLKTLVGIWSTQRCPIWVELEKTLHYEYNPIHNYDRKEDRGELITRDLATTTDRKYTLGESAEQQTNEDNAETASSTNTNSKTGYDGEDLVVASEDVGSARTEQNNLQTVEQKRERTDTDDIDNTDTGTIDTRETIYARGNIGVTSTQQLIESQREVVQFDIYQYIIDDFKKRFCLLVY